MSKVENINSVFIFFSLFFLSLIFLRFRPFFSLFVRCRNSGQQRICFSTLMSSLLYPFFSFILMYNLGCKHLLEKYLHFFIHLYPKSFIYIQNLELHYICLYDKDWDLYIQCCKVQNIWTLKLLFICRQSWKKSVMPRCTSSILTRAKFIMFSLEKPGS